jgi:hypothetical protein
MEEIIAERVKEAVEAQIVPLCAALDRIIANLGALNRRADEMNAELASIILERTVADGPGN